MREIWLDICIVLAVMVAGTVVGWLLVEQDERWYYSLVPGGMAGVQRMVAAFQERGVKVLWACFPWDHGTRNTGRAEYVDLVEIVIESGADGINVSTARPLGSFRSAD